MFSDLNQGGIIVTRHTPQRWFATCALLFLTIGFAFAACATSSVPTGGGTSTPGSPNPTDILQHAKDAALKDTTFAFTLSGMSASASTTAAPTITGTGRLTTHPPRIDVASSAIQFQGVTIAGEVIIDQASQTYYLKVPVLNQWVKIDPTALGINLGVITILNYDGLQNVTYQGSETLNSIATWHIQGTLQFTQSTPLGNAAITRTEDLWFRQSDYYPVKITIQDVLNATSSGGIGAGTPTPSATDPAATPSATLTPTGTVALPGSLAFDASPTVAAQATLLETFTFSAWDSGLTITLPATSNIKGGG